jgi:hypothetical protein
MKTRRMTRNYSSRNAGAMTTAAGPTTALPDNTSRPPINPNGVTR